VALKKMEGSNCVKTGLKQKEDRKNNLKNLILQCASRLYMDGVISTKLKTYEEVINSIEVNKWLKDNTPDWFKKDSDIFNNAKSLNQKRITQRELKINSKKVDSAYVELIIKCCGYKTAEEVPLKDIEYIAKKYKVAQCVVLGIIEKYFNKLSRQGSEREKNK